MARTALFAWLHRQLRLASLANRMSLPAADLLDAIGSRRGATRAAPVVRPRRRRLLQASAAGGVAALAGCVLPPRADPREPPVVVVGAGIAGLTAAWRLAGAGVPVRVFDAQPRIGGRVLTLRSGLPPGQHVELGGEFINSDHANLLGLCRELGLELDDLADDDSARTVWHFGGERRSPAQIVAALQPLARRAQAQRDAIGDAAITYRSAPPAARALDAISIADWLDATGVGGWPRALIDTAYTAEYGVELERQSALNLVTALDPQPDASGVTGTSDERYRIRGGNDRIAAALGERLAGAIEPEAVLEALRQRRDGRYLCSFRRDGASTDVEAAQVVLAIPFTLLRQVRLDVELPAAKSRAIATLGYGTNAKLVIPFAQRHWRIAHGASGTVLTDGPLQLVWDAMRRQPGAAGALTQYLGGRRGVALGSGAPHAHARDAIGELDSIFGGIAAHADAARAVRMHWPTQRWALGSYSCYLPGQWCAVRGAEGEAVEGLFFAGEHCSLDAQGFIEGACSSGEDAARQVLASRVRAARARAPTGPGPFRAAPSTPSFRASSSPARLSASSSSRTASARTATASG